MRKYKIILSFFVLFIILNMILKPSLYIEQTLNGLTAWALHVLPSILPFMFFTKVLTSLGTIEKASRVFGQASKKLFKTPPISAFVFLTSVVSGYPVGAKMTADLYQSGKITKEEAFKMCSFCSTSGPMFIIGAVGIGMLGNALYGYIIIISHILGALINGIVFRNLKVKSTQAPTLPSLTQPSNQDLSSMVLDSTLSVISVGAIIAIFYVIITAISPLFSILPQQIASIFNGIIEITKGCADISQSFSSVWSVVATTFIISFGGISTILQSITLLNKLDMPIKLFIFQKLTHALISTLISALLILIL